MDATWSQPRPYPFDDDPPPRREIPCGELRGAPWSATPAAERIRRAAGAPPRLSTPGKERRRRRDLVILLCHEVGLAQEVIADVFGISRTQVRDVIHKIKIGHG